MIHTRRSLHVFFFALSVMQQERGSALRLVVKSVVQKLHFTQQPFLQFTMLRRSVNKKSRDVTKKNSSQESFGKQERRFLKDLEES